MKIRAYVLFFVFVLSSHAAWALTITAPAEGDTFYAGSQLTIIAKPDADEKFVTVLFGVYPMSYDPSKNEYSYTLTIPKYLSGSADDLIVIASDISGNVTELRRGIFVKMPSNVVLQGIKAGSKVAYGSKLVLLSKMPEGSSLADIEKYENAEIRVDGQYSDGVKRKLNSSASGTTYTSSDETIAKVDSEGKVTAQSVGKAKITVKNGNFSATVDVIVKPYKK